MRAGGCSRSNAPAWWTRRRRISRSPRPGLAARSLDAPVALLTLLTPTRQWFKSRYGLDMVETPRGWAFCNHTILQKGVVVAGSPATDQRFAENPAVSGKLGFRFYAGLPVASIPTASRWVHSA